MLTSEPECTRRLRNPLASSACPAAVQTDCRCGPNAAASEETKPARDPTSDIIRDSKPAEGLPRRQLVAILPPRLAACGRAGACARPLYGEHKQPAAHV